MSGSELSRPPSGRASAGGALSELAGLVDRALEDRWESLPLLATFHGVRGWDHELGDWSLEAAQDRLAIKKDLIRRLRGVKPEGLEEELDHKVLLGQLEVQQAEIERYRRLEWDPALAPLNAVRSLHALLVRDLPDADRREAMGSRLAQVPLALRRSLDCLRVVDATMAALALSSCRSAAVFLHEAVRPLAPKGVPAALKALVSYASELKGRLLPRAARRFPCGEGLFELKLRREHGVSLDCRELLELGREHVARLQERLQAAAEELEPGSDWREVLARLKRDAPDAGSLLPLYRAETERARRFCVERELVTLPPGEELAVEPTPGFERDTSPYAALLPPGAFDRSLRSVFWVTPVDPRWSAAEQKRRLEGHCVHGLPVVCPHEGYPGHHVQLARAARISSKVRRVFSTPVLVEGWALYCEAMMEEQGYMTSPQARLYRLKDLLWRACRVVVDVGLHAQGWSPFRAAAFLVREALLEEPNAVAEVTRYCYTPTQPMSYLVGQLEILKLRRRCEAVWGRGYSLRRFHDWLLDFGNMPPSWIAPEMGGGSPP